MSIPLPDVERLSALRRMKAIAASLLVAAAIVYILCRALTDSTGGWGYLQAAATFHWGLVTCVYAPGFAAFLMRTPASEHLPAGAAGLVFQIGRASCRERVYVLV